MICNFANEAVNSIFHGILTASSVIVCLITIEIKRHRARLIQDQNNIQWFRFPLHYRASHIGFHCNPVCTITI